MKVLSKGLIYKMHKSKNAHEKNSRKEMIETKSYPHPKVPKNRKNRVIHEVIHVIHRKNRKKFG